MPAGHPRGRLRRLHRKEAGPRRRRRQGSQRRHRARPRRRDRRPGGRHHQLSGQHHVRRAVRRRHGHQHRGAVPDHELRAALPTPQALLASVYSLREWTEARPGAGEAVSHGRHHSQGAAGVVFFSRAQDTRAGHRGRDQAGLLLHKTPPR
uniref:Uncharacterized protein n=1 Tax=Zea mays TaxID=4577 RepID=C4J5H9_MAIZE|nr:unknown [Zea mays]ACR36753.1 unknown [Zea mays]ACR36959.1 unknown [Zea mays]